MRFVLIGPAFPLRGGIAQHTEGLAGALRRDHKVLCVTFSRQYPGWLFPGRTQQVETEAFSGEAPVAERWLDSLDPFSWRRAATRIADFRPDAVIMQWWHPYFGWMYASLLRNLRSRWRVPVLLLCHNVFPHERLPIPLRWIESVLISRVFSRADGFLVQSRQLGLQVAGFNAAAPQRRIAHPVYDFFSRWDPGPSGHRDRPLQLLFFGKIRRYKGLEVFLEALHRLDGRLPFEATIAGEFYLNPRPFHELAQRHRLGDRIRWESRYLPDEEVPALFRNADLVVLPYLQATQSGVVPLAYLFDTPVIASDVGGLSELVIPGRTGYLCPPGDAACLAESIAHYFGEQRHREFQENIRGFRRELSWQHVTDSILDLLVELRSAAPA